MAISTAVDQSALARAVAVETKSQDLRLNSVVYLPQRVAVVGQGNSASTYALTKTTFTNASVVGATYGYGSPVHLAAMQLLPVNGDGLGTIPMTIYPLEDAIGALPSEGDITPANAATSIGSYRVQVNGVLSEAFIVDIGDSVADIVAAMVTAVNAVLTMPVIASNNTTDVVLTSKWAGASANSIKLSVVGPSVGVTFAFTQPVGGATNPDVDDALALFGNIWETLVVNCLEVADTVSLSKYSVFGEARWSALIKKPLIVFTGNNVVDMTAATAVTAARTTDRVNSVIQAPGSVSLPLEIAARAVARTARMANNNPPHDYCRQVLSGVDAGSDSEQWIYAERDAAVKRGSSTTQVVSNQIQMDNTVTCYFPVGDPQPAYRKVVYIVKLQQVLYNLNRIFESDSWAGAPLIPDNQATTNKTAKQPKDAKSAIAAMIDALALAAIISDPVYSKNTIQAGISSINPDRLDVSFTVKIGGNSDIISVDFNFGFYFGESALVA